MSIWASRPHIGTDPHAIEAPDRGHILTYAEGWSNHYPDHSGEAELPAMVALAHVPAWCVPGHHRVAEDPSNEAFDHIGPWVRLDLHADRALNFWRDGNERPSAEPLHASVVLDEQAARALRDDLDAWLDQPKAHPKEAGK